MKIYNLNCTYGKGKFYSVSIYNPYEPTYRFTNELLEKNVLIEKINNFDKLISFRVVNDSIAVDKVIKDYPAKFLTSNIVTYEVYEDNIYDLLLKICNTCFTEKGDCWYNFDILDGEFTFDGKVFYTLIDNIRVYSGTPFSQDSVKIKNKMYATVIDLSLYKVKAYKHIVYNEVIISNDKYELNEEFIFDSISNEDPVGLYKKYRLKQIATKLRLLSVDMQSEWR